MVKVQSIDYLWWSAVDYSFLVKCSRLFIHGEGEVGIEGIDWSRKVQGSRFEVDVVAAAVRLNECFLFGNKVLILGKGWRDIAMEVCFRASSVVGIDWWQDWDWLIDFETTGVFFCFGAAGDERTDRTGGRMAFRVCEMDKNAWQKPLSSASDY